jgi:uncharacterized protein
VRGFRAVLREHPLASFFTFAYAVSWAFWLPAVFASLGWIGPVPSGPLHLAGGLGPMVAAVAVTSLIGGQPARSRLARRGVAGGRWIALAVLIPAGLFLVSTGLIAFTDSSITWENIGRSTEFPELPRPAYWLANVVFYGYGEEVGWRGFALPRLQVRASALRASFAVAVMWSGWHIPLFVFSPGLSSLGLFGTIGWLFSLGLGSILLTWLFNASRGSIAAVALFHATLDVFMMSPVSADLQNVMGALLTVGALLLIPAFGGEHLAHRARIVDP